MRGFFVVFVAFLALIAGVLAALRRLVQRRERIDWLGATIPGKILDVDGVGVHSVESGHGPPVVLIHGLGGNTFTFRYLIPDLARDHRVIALDLKGFGYSQRIRDGGYSMIDQARLVIGLMDTLGIQKAIVVGHSMGGAVAMNLAAAWPDRVDKLVLVASASGDRIPMAPPWLLRPFLPLGRLFRDRLFNLTVYDRSTITEEMREGYRRPALIRGTARAVYETLRDSRRDVPIAYGRIVQPTLLLWGERDRVLPSWMLPRLRQRLPNAEFASVERTGHMPLEERPEECNAIIRRFLEAPARPAELSETLAAGS